MKHRIRLYVVCLLGCVMLTACRDAVGTAETTDTTLPEGTVTMTTDEATTEVQTTEPSEIYDFVRVSHTDFEHVTMHGRTLHGEHGYHIEWPYAGFTLRGWFSGELRMFYRDAEGYMDKTVLSVRVDGGESEQVTILKNGSSVLLATLSEGYHEITVRKGAEITAFRFVLTMLSYRGRTVEAEGERPLAIEVIGDSISNGIGAIQTETGTYRYLNGSNCMASFSGMLAERLRADMNVIAMSGWGVSRGSVSAEDCIPTIYGEVSPFAGKGIPWEVSSFQPDLVIVALGTNDHGGDPETLRKEAVAFLTTLRQSYPEAPIVWMYGMGGTARASAIQAAIDAMADDQIRYLEVECDRTGRTNHPCEEAQRRYAEVLEELIDAIL
ncbi:MAG: hypothetical protein E7618_06745 [Ruminococcaceae bacterium]|nr:hypothetical protein [Oscillospiraceae bacterium]